MLDWTMRAACLGLIGVCAAASTWRFAHSRIAARPSLGPVGAARRRALDRSPVWRALEPIVRALASAVAPHVSPARADLIGIRLRHAGQPLGLEPADLVALSLMAACIGAWLGIEGTRELQWPMVLAIVPALLFAAAPWLRVGDMAQRRGREIERTLPATVDLAALAMEAGLDFGGAIEEVCLRATGSGALLEELSQMLEALRLGHTRRHALETMGRNVPTEPVRQFVAAVIQAEERGNPLVPVLRIQAATLRRNRSVLAEEAASNAALWLTLPMMLLLSCILLILIGPFLVGGPQVTP